MNAPKTLREASCADDYDPNSMPVERARALIRTFLAPGHGDRARPHPRGARIACSRSRYLVAARRARPRQLGDGRLCGALRRSRSPTARRRCGASASRSPASRSTATRRRRPVRADLHRRRDARRRRHRRDAGARERGRRSRAHRRRRADEGGPEPPLRRRGPEARASRVRARASTCVPPSSACWHRSASAKSRVYRKLRVAFFSTGDELKSIGTAARRRRDLRQQPLHDLRHARRGSIATSIDMGVVPDVPDALERAFAEAPRLRGRRHHDRRRIGRRGRFREATLLDKLGEVLFWKIAMKPGRPLAYGRIGGAHFFGLPGQSGVGDGDVLRVRARRAADAAGTARRRAAADVQGAAAPRRSEGARAAPSSSAAFSPGRRRRDGPCAPPAIRARASCRRCRGRTASSCCRREPPTSPREQYDG